MKRRLGRRARRALIGRGLLGGRLARGDLVVGTFEEVSEEDVAFETEPAAGARRRLPEDQLAAARRRRARRVRNVIRDDDGDSEDGSGAMCM